MKKYLSLLLMGVCFNFSMMNNNHIESGEKQVASLENEKKQVSEWTMRVRNAMFYSVFREI